MKLHFFFLILLSLLFFSCEESLENTDLTRQIIGEFNGTVTLSICSPEAVDIENQRILIEKIDDNTVRIIPQIYPDSSPLDSLQLTADLTPTPLGFINTTGVMLTIASENYELGTVAGTPFSIRNVQEDAHGKFDQDISELLFALEIIKDGVPDYEFFVGTKE